MLAGAAAAWAGATAALPPRILNITTPHVGHLPLIAFRPFFMVSSTASAISFFALHLTQYPSGIKSYCTFRFWRICLSPDSLGAVYGHRQPVKRHFLHNLLKIN